MMIRQQERHPERGQEASILATNEVDSRGALWIFGFLTAIYLLSFGPMNWQFTAWNQTWITMVLTVSSLLVFLFAKSGWNKIRDDVLAHYSGPSIDTLECVAA
jgi:hypothetical protein